MELDYNKWSTMILLGAADLDVGNTDKAIQHYQRAMILANRLIDDTILTFDGDIRPLNLYTYACSCLVQGYIRMGDSAAARACLEQTGRKFLSVLTNSVYPVLIRGKVIREFEPLMNLAIELYRLEGRPDEAYATVSDWLTNVKQYIAQLRPFAETVLLN